MVMLASSPVMPNPDGTSNSTWAMRVESVPSLSMAGLEPLKASRTTLTELAALIVRGSEVKSQLECVVRDNALQAQINDRVIV